MAEHGHFYWNELHTRDAKKAMAFYGKSLGWTFDEMDMGDGTTYYICKQGEVFVGGIFAMPSPEYDGIPERWFSYIAVDDVDKRIATAVELGANIIREPFDVEGTGRIAIVQDSTGANLGWMTPSTA